MINKLTIGLQKKVGQPNYGSLGASCTVEVSLADDEATDAQSVTRHIRDAFRECHDHIDEQLALPTSSRATSNPSNANPARGPAKQGRERPASEAQVRAIHAIAGKHKLSLSDELTRQFGVTSPADLTIRQASELIDNLKSAPA